MAQTKGTFETHDFDNFRLHVYHTNDALGDASYIVEGTQAVVTLEQPLSAKTSPNTTPTSTRSTSPSKRASPTTMWAGQATTRRSCPQGCPPSRRMQSTTA